MIFSQDHRRRGRRGYKDRAAPFGGLGRYKVRGLAGNAEAEEEGEER